jgi:anti-anti-sigma factor
MRAGLAVAGPWERCSRPWQRDEPTLGQRVETVVAVPVPSFDVATSQSSARVVSSDRGEVVVWLHGEHDIATVQDVTWALAKAMSLGDGEVIVDLRGVTFIAAATVRVIIQARELLRARSRDLMLRSPSMCAIRVLDLCAPGATTGSGLAAHG